MEESVKKQQTHLQTTYNPMLYKTFTGALEAFFAQECPQTGGLRNRQVLVQAVEGHGWRVLSRDESSVRQGQIQWVAVDKDETSSYGKSMRRTKIKSVVLDLVRSQDIKERAEGKRLREIKKESAMRLFEPADQQNGCPSQPGGDPRYTQNFKQVLLCQQKGLNEKETSFASKYRSGWFGNTMGCSTSSSRRTSYLKASCNISGRTCNR
jgi:hypothetical protein